MYYYLEYLSKTFGGYQRLVINMMSFFSLINGISKVIVAL